MALSGRLEVLNSLLVRIAFQVANQKLLLDEDVREEVWALFTRLHGAFERDLEGFARLVK